MKEERYPDVVERTDGTTQGGARHS
jgi:hypothetical protein